MTAAQHPLLCLLSRPVICTRLEQHHNSGLNFDCPCHESGLFLIVHVMVQIASEYCQGRRHPPQLACAAACSEVCTWFGDMSYSTSWNAFNAFQLSLSQHLCTVHWVQETEMGACTAASSGHHYTECMVVCSLRHAGVCALQLHNRLVLAMIVHL